MGLLEKAATQTGLPKATILKLGLSFLVLFVVFGIGSALITNLLGVAYPVFMSFHALETHDRSDD